MALVLPIVLLLLCGVLEYGRYLMTLHVVQNAAREGCRYALAHTEPITIAGVTSGNSTGDVLSRINSYLAGVGLQSQSVQVYMSDNQGNNLGPWTDTQFGQYICVRITGNFRWVTPQLLLLPSQTPVTVQALMRSEAN
jgi:Flp pilus assembly protein TadG